MALLSFTAQDEGGAVAPGYNIGAMTQAARALVQPDNIPDYLKSRPQWVLWQYVSKKSGGKPSKPPKTIHGGNAKPNDPATWTTFDAALAAFNKNPRFAGIGFCLSPDDGLVGIDIDDYGDSPAPDNLAIRQRFSGTFIESSPSGTAATHIWLFGKIPDGIKAGSKVEVSETLSLEYYKPPSSRYLTITGNVINHADITQQQDSLEWLLGTYFAKHKPLRETLTGGEPAAMAGLEPTDTEREAQPAKPALPPSVSVASRPADYDRRLRALLSKPHSDISRLYRGDTLHFITPDGNPDRSAAECSLIVRLASAADGRMDILMRWMNNSGCSKWKEEDRDSYRLPTLEKGLSGWDGNPWIDPWEEQRQHGRLVAAGSRRGPANNGNWKGKADEDAKWQARDPLRENDDGELKICDMATLRGATLQPPQFVINPLIPRGHLTLFGGHGGSGKTTVSYVLACHVACGKNWADLPVSAGRVLIASFEDGKDLIFWRLRNIVEEYRLDFEAVETRLTVIDATDAQGLMTEFGEGGVRQAVATEYGLKLYDFIVQQQYDLVIIDNASDAFDGDENQRRQVRRFVRFLAKAVSAHNGAILLLAHIDKSAARYGAGKNSYSGSTSWHNSARSRLALMDNELCQEKLNVGKCMESAIPLAWNGAVPVPADSDGALLRQTLLDSADDKALLACFAAANEAGATVVAADTGPVTTWHNLSVYPELPKHLKEDRQRFRETVARLVRQGKVRREDYMTTNRKQKQRLVMVNPD